MTDRAPQFECRCLAVGGTCLGCRADAAVAAAAAAERAKWVAACWKAYNAGYADQGWTVLYEMGATQEVPK